LYSLRFGWSLLFRLRMSGSCDSLCCFAFSSLFSVACCCFLLMNHDVTVSTTLCCRVLTLVCCLSVHAVPGFIGTWLPNTYRTFGSLALGCPTYTCYWLDGTWLPNSTIRHVVAQHLDLVLCRHMGAQHVFRSTCLYISFDLAGRASYRL